MTTSMGPLESFTHLADNIPSWLSKLDDLTLQVAEQNARFIRIHQSDQRQLKKKQTSVESLRPNDDDDMAFPTITATDTYTPPNPSHKCLSHASRARIPINSNPISSPVSHELRRKRKPESILSHVSGNAHYRAKSMVVVYYDSVIQDIFEFFVRGIAGACNMLRKGRTALTFKNRMASLGLEAISSPSTNELAMLSPKILRSSHKRGRLETNSKPPDPMSCFDEADSDLETAQSLCEVGAHQFLRDGDCRLEIQGIRKKFEKCLDLAKKEVERLREEAAREAKETEMESEKEVTMEAEPVLTTVEMPVVDILSEKGLVEPPIKHPGFNGIGTIEVDDAADAGSIHIDLSAFRRSRRI